MGGGGLVSLSTEGKEALTHVSGYFLPRGRGFLKPSMDLSVREALVVGGSRVLASVLIV